MLTALGDYILMVDADGATQFSDLKKLQSAVRLNSWILMWLDERNRSEWAGNCGRIETRFDGGTSED